MRWRFVVVAIVISVTSAYPQNTTVDSLLQKLALMKGRPTDTHGLALLITLSKTYGKIDYDQGIAYAARAIRAAETLRLPLRKAEALNIQALCYRRKEAYTKAIFLFEEALESYRQGQDLLGEMKVLANMGRVYADIGVYAKAFDYQMMSLELKKKYGTPENIANTMMSLGIIWRAQNRNEQAWDYFQQALNIYKEAGNRLREGAVLNQMAMIKRDEKEYGRALDYHRQASNLFRSIGDTLRSADVLNNMGNLYEIQGINTKAYSYYRQSLDISEKSNSYAIRTRGNLAAVCLQLGYDKECREQLDKMLPLLDKVSKSYIDRKNAYKVLVAWHEKKDNHKKANAYREKAEAMKDSIFNEKMSRQIAEMQARFDLERKNEQLSAQKQQITVLEQKKAADKKLRIALCAGGLLLIILLGFIYHRYKEKQKSAVILESKSREIAIMNKELEKRMLRAQMDPHFIFNSLNSIQYLITANDRMAALKYLSKFSKLLRQTLENSVSHSVPIIDEIRVLEHYLQLESLRFDDKFRYEIDLDHNLDIHTIEIPFLLLQPYVENAIVHGLVPKQGKGHLKLKIKCGGTFLLCSIEDNGIGRTEAHHIQSQKRRNYPSRAMSVTKRRLELINKDKEEKTSVEVIDLFDAMNRPNGTKVKIKIPLEP